MKMSKTLLLKPLCDTFWCFTTIRHYARKVRVIPSAIKVDPQVNIPRGQNSFKTKPEHLFLEEIEGDFDHPLTVHQMQYLVEERKEMMRKLHKKMHFKATERKFFKELKPSEPNLLTWGMKEHLYSLHQSDPELWNIQALSYAFPKSQAAIKKFLAAPRKLYTPQQIKEHDMKVIENWKTLTKDKLGNYGILKKMVNKRLSSLNKETSLSLPIDETFPNVIFTPTDDPTVDEIRNANHIPSRSSTRWRRENPTFKDIITQYEDLKRQKDPSATSHHSPPSPEISTEKPLTQALTHDPPDVQIRSPFSQRKPRDRFQRSLTLEEYKYLKKLK